MYYTTDSVKAPRKKDMNRNYLSLSDKKFVVSTLNEVGLYLLEFYMSKAGTPQYEYSDAKTAQALGWTIGKTKDNRLKLEKANLFKQDTYGTGEKKAVVTTIGKAIELFRNANK